MRFASAPTAWISPDSESSAITDGSDSTMPRPRTYTSVLAVPRSTATSRPVEGRNVEKERTSEPEPSGFPLLLPSVATEDELQALSTDELHDRASHWALHHGD